MKDGFYNGDRLLFFSQKTCYNQNIFFPMPQQITENTTIGNPLYEWSFPEYEKFSRGRLWYAVMIGLGVVFVVYGMVTGNFLFSLIIALFGIILFLQQHQDPHEIAFAVTDLGIILGNRFYPYKELEAFYIIYNPPVKTLFFETKNLIRPRIHVPMGDQNPLDLRFALLEFLPEDLEKDTEPTSEMAARNWKIQ